MVPVGLFSRTIADEKTKAHSQLQQRQVGVAVECPVLTLLHDIVLEYRGRLGVVSVEAVEDGVDVGGTGLALVESDAHCVGMGGWMGGWEGGEVVGEKMAGWTVR